MSNDPYCVLDLETTGLDPAKDSIIELGLMICGSSIPHPKPHCILVKQDQPLQRDIIELTGIDDALLVSEGVPLGNAVAYFLSVARGLPIIGHNILRFDRPFMIAALQRCKIEQVSLKQALRFDRFFDTAGEYKARKLGMIQGPEESLCQFHWRVLETRAYGVKYNLRLACQEMGIDVTDCQAHRAAGDVTLTHRLYTRLMKA